MSNENEQKEAFYELMHALMDLKRRVNEIRAFYKVWDEIFDNLVKITGREHEINIANQRLLETYTTEKFHTIISDLHSSLKSQSIYQKSLLKLLGSEFNYSSLDNWLKETNSRYQNEAIDEIKSYKRGEDISINDLTSTLCSKIEPTRHSFNHRHEKMIVSKYDNERIIRDINTVDSVLSEYMRLIYNIGLIKFNTTFEIKSEITISDYLYDIRDLILFGSTRSAIQHFIPNWEEGYSKKEEFSKLRNEYYEKFIVELINE